MVGNIHFSSSNNSLNFINSLSHIAENPFFLLIIICVSGFLIRFYYFPFGLPIIADGTNFFWYAVDISVLETFPTKYTFPNNGWPTFLSVFFSLYHSENLLDYMALQRVVTIVLSILTIIPVYLLCRRFFEKNLSIIGAALFTLNPLIISNSLLGITEPLFILLGTSSLALFLSKDIKKVYFSFVLASLFVLVRYEGLVLIIPLSIMFIVRFRKEKIFKIALRYITVLSIFVLVLLPMAYIRIQTIGYDGIISNVSSSSAYVYKISQKENTSTSNITSFFISGIINLVKYLGWVTIPIFIFFLPFGIFKYCRNIDYKKMTIILVSIFFLIPAFYASGRGIQETRYLFVLFPIFSILSLYTINSVQKRINKYGLISILLIGGIVLASIIFLEFKKIDYEHEHELFNISKEVIKRAEVINHYPEAKYLDFSDIIMNNDNFPFSRVKEKIRVITPYSGSCHQGFVLNINEDCEPLPLSVDAYLVFAKKNELKHLIVSYNTVDPPFLQDVYLNEQNYPFLIKEFDSKEHGYDYHVKIFRIDFEKYFKSQKM